MAKKNENDFPNNALVQKSRPLFSLWKEKEKINLFEYKMLDMYLARINSHDPSHRVVKFTASDFNEILSSHLTKAELHDKLKKFQGMVVSYGEDEAVTLFEYSRIRIDNDTFDVQLMCTETAHKYFFNIENIGYFKYKFKNILEINSMYSYILFNFLEMNRFREQPFEVDVHELKKILDCDTPTYSSFYRFNDHILKRCHKELTSKTELQFTYETIKTGRSVTAVSFNIAPLKKFELEDSDIIEVEATEDEGERTDISSESKVLKENEVIVENPRYSQSIRQREEVSEEMEFYMESCDNTFTLRQMKLILSTINSDVLEESEFGHDISIYNYLDLMYKKLLAEEDSREIANRFKYFLSMIKNDKGE